MSSPLRICPSIYYLKTRKVHTPESFNSTSAGNLNLAGLFPSLPAGATALPREYHTTYLLNCYVITVLMLIVETMFQGLSEREESLRLNLQRSANSFWRMKHRKRIRERRTVWRRGRPCPACCHHFHFLTLHAKKPSTLKNSLVIAHPPSFLPFLSPAAQQLQNASIILALTLRRLVGW